ncbi:casparian strip membrane protein [Artemisia annua]|uniref:CASP-like protein n=1 Tax=Artemisia annua TaxID=35608 RepID=A0A2U1QDR1_ARTAN|nr:casparian strip membrane protein [Artemisia annua]
MTSITPTLESPVPTPEYKDSANIGGLRNHLLVDVVLRVILFATALVAIIIMVTSKQTQMIPVASSLAIPEAAKFSQIPAFTYYVAALSVACLYSIITCVLTVFSVVKPKGSSKKLLVHFIILDSLLLGILAAATGAAGAVGYIGYRGNSHTRRNKVCDVYASFCSHITVSLSVSLFPSVALLHLIWHSVIVLAKRDLEQRRRYMCAKVGHGPPTKL